MLENQPIIMIRENMENVPFHPLPLGFSFTWYQAGDEIHWVRIHLKADQFNPICQDLFFEQFGRDALTLSKRQVYIINDQGNYIGTSTAWLNPNFNGMPFGRIHWVALLPEYQGRGLAKPLLSLTCSRLKELGHDRAYLTTSAARTAALGLYFKFGFSIMTTKQVWSLANG